MAECLSTDVHRRPEWRLEYPPVQKPDNQAENQDSAGRRVLTLSVLALGRRDAQDAVDLTSQRFCPRRNPDAGSCTATLADLRL